MSTPGTSIDILVIVHSRIGSAKARANRLGVVGNAMEITYILFPASLLLIILSPLSLCLDCASKIVPFFVAREDSRSICYSSIRNKYAIVYDVLYLVADGRMEVLGYARTPGISTLYLIT